MFSNPVPAIVGTCIPTSSNAKKIREDFSQSSISDRVHFADDKGYTESIGSYFSRQAVDTKPICVIIPESTADVSEAVKILTAHYEEGGQQPTFAVRSGGHATFAGANNIDAGVTIDLRRMNQVTISTDRKTVTIGSGGLWADVYRVLSKESIGITGGRGGSVGVGGLTMGGGLSFYSPRYGFVCDRVVSYETVVAGGEVINASASTASDLWKALKGGGNNFGIVTRFTVEAFESGPMWGGNIYHDMSTAEDHLQAIYDFTRNKSYDPHSSVTQSFMYRPNPGFLVIEQLEYTKAESHMEPDDPIFGAFTSIPFSGHTMRITDLSDLGEEITGMNTLGLGQAFITTSFVNDRQMLSEAFNLWKNSVQHIKHVHQISWTLTLQPLPRIITDHAKSTGGNVLGLDNAPPLILALLSVTWDDRAADQVTLETGLKLFDDIDAASTKRGLYHPFKYANYSWATQDVVNGRGHENKKFLQDVSRKYDPKGLFQKGVPGGFKLWP